jgi:hypothetical protein
MQMPPFKMRPSTPVSRSAVAEPFTHDRLFELLDRALLWREMSRSKQVTPAQETKHVTEPQPRPQQQQQQRSQPTPRRFSDR